MCYSFSVFSIVRTNEIDRHSSPKYYIYVGRKTINSTQLTDTEFVIYTGNVYLQSQFSENDYWSHAVIKSITAWYNCSVKMLFQS